MIHRSLLWKELRRTRRWVPSGDEAGMPKASDRDLRHDGPGRAAIGLDERDECAGRDSCSSSRSSHRWAAREAPHSPTVQSVQAFGVSIGFVNHEDGVAVVSRSVLPGGERETPAIRRNTSPGDLGLRAHRVQLAEAGAVSSDDVDVAGMVEFVLGVFTEVTVEVDEGSVIGHANRVDGEHALWDCRAPDEGR